LIQIPFEQDAVVIGKHICLNQHKGIIETEKKICAQVFE
jgi:hypothetical protein